MKRYYWLKLPENWFQQKKIKKLRRIAGGDTYTIIYLKMMLASIKQEGKLFFEGVEETFHEELATELDEDPENVKIALAYLSAQHLVEIVETDEYLLPEAVELTGSESASAERVRRFRDREREKKTLQCNTSVTEQLRTGNVEIEKEKEIEIEKDIYKTFCPVPAEAGPGPQSAEVTLTAGKDAKGIGGTAEDGVKGIDAGAGKMVEKAAEPSPEVFITIPLNAGKEYEVTTEYVAEMQKLYPAVDVAQQLRQIRAWALSNPKNRKTLSGIKRHINGWLAREQNRAPRDSRNQLPVQNKNRFNNFEQRGYDYSALERQLLKSQKGKNGGENAKADYNGKPDG